jgi:uncharacterized protein YgiM (DUF1202 family)
VAGIILCGGLVLVIRAFRERSVQATPTALSAEIPTAAEPTATFPLEVEPTALITPTATVVLPISPTVMPTAFTEIAIGAPVVVTASPSLTLRAQPGTNAASLGQLKKGTELIVLDGPQKAGAYTWWKVRRADGTGQEGWVAGEFLQLKTGQ